MNNMKTKHLTTFILGLSLLFTGCVEVTFPEPMPLNRRDKAFFPKNLHGVWYYVGDENDLEDSLTIYSEFIDFGEKPLILNEKNKLRKFNGYFILSTSEDREERWVIYLAKYSDNVLSIYDFDGEDEEKIAIWEEVLLGDAVEKIQKEGGSSNLKEIRLNPSNNYEFRQLINRGGLSHRGDYVR